MWFRWETKIALLPLCASSLCLLSDVKSKTDLAEKVYRQEWGISNVLGRSDVLRHDRPML